MIAETLRHGLFMVCFVLGSVFAFPQGTPVTVGPLAVTVPPGWNVPADHVPSEGVQIYSADSTLQQYLRVQISTPQQITQSAREYHALMIQRFSQVIPPGSPQQSGVLGPFIFTRFMMQLGSDPPHAMIWYSAKSGSQYVAITAEATNPDLMTRNLPALEAMVRGASLGGAPAAPAASSAPPPGAGNSAGPQANVTGLATLGEYVFTTPAGWATTQYSDGLVLMSPASPTNSERCIMTISPMRPAGANLLTDAYSIFQDVYKDYQLTNQTPRGSAMPQSDVHGISGQGWEYVIVRRGIAPRGSRESRLGFVFVAKLNNRLAVISGLSKDPLVSTCMGELVHDAWPRFFYSLSFKSWPPTDQSAAMRKRMAGVWTAATATAATRFTFAANGRYAGAAASQQYTNISNTELLTTTQAFFGDGAYTLRGNAITLTPDSQKNNPEPGLIRVEEESKDGGRTWAESLYLLRTSVVNGQEYEVRYAKK